MASRLPFLAVRLLGAVTAGILITGPASAQDRLPGMPGYENYSRMSREINAAARPIFQSSINSIVWLASGNGFEYALGGKFYRYDYASRQKIEIPALSAQPA